MTKETLPARNEIPREETWNLESIFPSVEAWEKAYKIVENRLPELDAYKGKLDQNPKTLLDCLVLREEILRGAEKVYVYSGLE